MSESNIFILNKLINPDHVLLNNAFTKNYNGCYASFHKVGSSDIIWLKCFNDENLEDGIVYIPTIHRLPEWKEGDKLEACWFHPNDFKNIIPEINSITVFIVESYKNKILNCFVTLDNLEKNIKTALFTHPITVGEKFSSRIDNIHFAFQIDKIEVKNKSVMCGIYNNKNTPVYINNALDFIKTIPLHKSIDKRSNNLFINADDLGSSSKIIHKKEDFSYVSKLMSEDMDFSQYGIGGLNKELTEIFRRAFISRRFSQEQLDKMGCKHVKGVLLYGLPGCGKTLIARKMAEILKITEPKIVNGPELLNKYVGESEANMRNLFAPADKNPDKVHVIIMDEIDALCRERGSGNSSSDIRDGLVNTILAELDGVKARNNIFLIGMTNRKEMIDKALLRPGRLEIQIEIGLPDAKGREAIFNVHLTKMKENGYLDNLINPVMLAEATVNFTGAEIAGLIRSAQSFAMMDSVRKELQDEKNNKLTASSDIKIDAQKILVTNEHFEKALNEIRPAFGIVREKWSDYQKGGFIGLPPDHLVKWCDQNIKSPMRTLLIHGEHGTGCTAVASYIAGNCKSFNFVRWLSASRILHMSEQNKAKLLRDTFENAFCCNRSLIVIDDLEEWIEYINMARFSSYLFKQLMNLCRQQPGDNKQCVLVCTTHEYGFFHAMNSISAFIMKEELNLLTDLKNVLETYPDLDVSTIPIPISIKELINAYGLIVK